VPASNCAQSEPNAFPDMQSTKERTRTNGATHELDVKDAVGPTDSTNDKVENLPRLKHAGNNVTQFADDRLNRRTSETDPFGKVLMYDIVKELRGEFGRESGLCRCRPANYKPALVEGRWMRREIERENSQPVAHKNRRVADRHVTASVVRDLPPPVRVYSRNASIRS
jgi:hypothetical protein